MTLAEMSTYVTTKVNQTEANDVAACKSFLRRDYELMFNDQLWKDSIAAIDMSLDPDNADNAAGVVVLPPLIDRPIAVRGANRGILVNPIERYYRIDLDMFIRQGTQYEMALLSPAWFTVRPVDDPFARDVLVAEGSITGAVSGVVVSQADPTPAVAAGFSFTTVGGQWYEIVADDNTLGYIVGNGVVFYLDEMVALTPGQTLRFQAADVAIALIQSGASFGDAFGGSASGLTLNAFQSSGAGSTLLIRSADNSDTSDIKVIWRDLAGKRYETTEALPSVSLTPDDDGGYFEIEAIYKSTTNGDVTVTLSDGSGLIKLQGTIPADDTRSPSYQRIRVFDIPNQSADIKVAGKIKCEALDFDNQEPQLRGCENILMSFAQADMLERERQYGKAQAKKQEAIALLEQYKRIEVQQQAHNMRLIPQEGFVTEYDLYSSNLLSF